MTMTLWECDEPGCTSKAEGVGGAIGLQALGWYYMRGGNVIGFEIGPGTIRSVGGATILCPLHRPDQRPCTEEGENSGKPCSTCRAEDVAAAARVLLDLDGPARAVELITAAARLVDQVAANLERIFVRDNPPGKGWGSYALAELPPARVLEHVARWIAEGRTAVVTVPKREEPST